jgi:hypothetical protein
MTISSCGLATMTMILNAVRASSGELAMGSISTEEGLLSSGRRQAARRVRPHGGGMSLPDFGHMERAFAIHRLEKEWRVSSPGSRSRQRDGRLQGRPGAHGASGTFIAVNFHLDRLYGDGVDVGHFTARRL